MISAQTGLLGSNCPAINSGVALNAKISFFSELTLNLSLDKDHKKSEQRLERLASWLQRVDNHICYELLLFKKDQSAAIEKLDLSGKDPYEVFTYICLNKIPKEGKLSAKTLLELRKREKEILSLVQKIKSQEARLKDYQKLISFLSSACNVIEKRFFEVSPDYGRID